MCLSMRDRPQTVGQMPGCFTEKYILHRRAYEKTRSAIPAILGSRRLRFSRHVAVSGKCGTTARQAAGYLGKCPNWANAFEHPPARLRGGLLQGLQTSLWGLTSRKGALWRRLLTKRRILYASSRADCAFPVTLRCPGSVGQPPARLRGTLENGPTGQMRSNNRPPRCGAGCARVRKPLFGV